ncbi:MAG: hypothetical protein A2992_05835 [Elusimicrobia bacterium RIFCSPLOWO2_01_FULL_59_12]|nr:MAG: hypothetical protein A2992_05835 [Elusimicrobia bacterium RIFCSPLOWO2_01_FULL_59_12]
MTPRILVIDDDPSLVHLMRADLEEEGYDVLTGYDGQVAIKLARTEQPDLIVLDVNMPMTNGLLAAQTIRKTAETKNIPIIMLSGEASEKIFPLIQEMGRMMHIKKPVDLDELNSLVRQVLQKYPPDQAHK